MRSLLSTDHQNEAAASSSTFKEDFGSSPQSNVFQGLVHGPLGILRLLQGSTEICILLDVLGLVHSHSLMSML